MGYESPSEEENFHSHVDAELRKLLGHPECCSYPASNTALRGVSQTGAGPTGEDQVVLSAYP